MADGQKKRIPHVLSIAGVAPSGGAGVLADIKAMSACGAYACGVITALTAQNTKGVTGVMPVPAAFVTEQLNTLFEDVRIDAVKIGMLNDCEVIEAVASAIERWKPRWVVLDPVMVAKSMDRLLREDAVERLRTRLLPLASVITPNIPEAGELLGIPTGAVAEDPEESARKLRQLMGRREGAWVLLKGGHLSGEQSTDLLTDGLATARFSEPRIETANTHGTGCTLSSALAAYLASTNDMLNAVRLAKAYITGAIRHADELDVGSGHGPTHHFFAMWPKVDEGGASDEA